MDNTWNKLAALYQFQCNGCEDNCCRSLFFHHTHIEKAYLLYGFDQLEQEKKNDILLKVEDYCRKTFSTHSGITSLKIMCPLNENGKCILYPYRPMICRLHGLPHEVRKPGFTPLMGKGCEAGLFDGKAYIQFDRTPFYQNMAQIEDVYRKKLKKIGKIKETIAQMLLSE
jgi:Fe-S-cluster containining protein